MSYVSVSQVDLRFIVGKNDSVDPAISFSSSQTFMACNMLPMVCDCESLGSKHCLAPFMNSPWRKPGDIASSERDGHWDSAAISYFITEELQVHTNVDLFLQALVGFPEWFFSLLNFVYFLKSS